jgi:cell shape-determining protein MreD
VTFSRCAAAMAAVLTALLLQATLVAPLAGMAAVSLPAVLIAVVALLCGPGTGMTLGFSAGLLADLGSSHPAGVLALAWMGLGLALGTLAQPTRTLWRQTVLVAIAGAVTALAVSAGLRLVDVGGVALSRAVTDSPWVALGDAILALVLVPVCRAFLASPALRPARVSQPPLSQHSSGLPRG